MSHNTLDNYYKTLWAMKQYHNYDILHMEEMIVFERDLYVAYTMEHLKELEKKQKA